MAPTDKLTRVSKNEPQRLEGPESRPAAFQAKPTAVTSWTELDARPLARRSSAIHRSPTGAEAAPDADEHFDAAARDASSEVPHRGEMEKAFGQDFSGVKASLGAEREMGAIGARAAARGETVAFASASPDRALVAHELTHVVQQRRSGPGAVAGKGELSDPAGAAELEADRVAERVATGRDAGPITAAPDVGIHRDGTPVGDKEKDEAQRVDAPPLQDRGQELRVDDAPALDKAPEVQVDAPPVQDQPQQQQAPLGQDVQAPPPQQAPLDNIQKLTQEIAGRDVGKVKTAVGQLTKEQKGQVSTNPQLTLQLTTLLGVQDTPAVLGQLGLGAPAVLGLARQAGWLNPATAKQVLTAYKVNNSVAQAAVAADATAVGALSQLGVAPDALFPELVQDGTALVTVAGIRGEFAAWLKQDWNKFSAITNKARDPWATALAATLQSESLVKLAVAKDGPAWKAALDKTGKFKDVVNALPKVVSNDLEPGLWNLYGDGKGRSADESMATFQKLYTAKIVTAVDPTIKVGGRVPIPVTPDASAWATLLKMTRPIPRGQVNLAPIVFAKEAVKYSDQTGQPVVPPDVEQITTSYYLGASKTILLRATSNSGAVDMNPIPVDSKGRARGTGGKGTTKTALSFFENHAKHEIGHAVGAKTMQGMTEAGNDFAKAWGGWSSLSESAFTMETFGDLATDVKLKIGNTDHDIAPSQVKVWLRSVLQDGAEPGGNSLTNVAASVADKVSALQSSSVKGLTLVKYFSAVYGACGGSIAKMPSSAYEFPGFSPSGEKVRIYASRMGGFYEYSKAAYDALKSTHGWYSMSSASEMFAEIYTRYYTDKKLPKTVNGKDPKAFFDKLEQSQDSMFAG